MAVAVAVQPLHPWPTHQYRINTAEGGGDSAPARPAERSPAYCPSRGVAVPPPGRTASPPVAPHPPAPPSHPLHAPSGPPATLQPAHPKGLQLLIDALASSLSRPTAPTATIPAVPPTPPPPGPALLSSACSCPGPEPWRLRRGTSPRPGELVRAGLGWAVCMGAAPPATPRRSPALGAARRQPAQKGRRRRGDARGGKPNCVAACSCLPGGQRKELHLNCRFP